MIGGKPLFSSLRENSANAEMIAEIEKTILTSARPVTWDDVVGLEGAKRSLEETMVLPLVAQVWIGVFSVLTLMHTNSCALFLIHTAGHGRVAVRPWRHLALRAPGHRKDAGR